MTTLSPAAGVGDGVGRGPWLGSSSPAGRSTRKAAIQTSSSSLSSRSQSPTAVCALMRTSCPASIWPMTSKSVPGPARKLASSSTMPRGASAGRARMGVGVDDGGSVGGSWLGCRPASGAGALVAVAVLGAWAGAEAMAVSATVGRMRVAVGATGARRSPQAVRARLHKLRRRPRIRIAGRQTARRLAFPANRLIHELADRDSNPNCLIQSQEFCRLNYPPPT